MNEEQKKLCEKLYAEHEEILNRSKDDEYIVVDIPQNCLSDECFTPNSFPRATQPTLGKYLKRIDGKSDFVNREWFIHPSVANKWLNKERHNWVTQYGKDDYFLHEMHKKYNKPNKNTKIANNIFPRPYQCEFEYMSLKKRELVPKSFVQCQPKKKEKPKEAIFNCEAQPPFWWRQDNPRRNSRSVQQAEAAPDQNRRWKPVANPVAVKNYTPCQRKEAMRGVGLPFRTEACNFYYHNYPAAKLKPIIKKLHN